MKFIEKLFNWMLVVGLLMLVGRVVTAVFLFMDKPFTTFFKDYSIISFVILIVGAIGSEMIKDNKRKRV